MFKLSQLPAPIIRHLNGFWRRRWIIAGVAWMAALVGWFGVWLIPDRYESRAQVYVQTETILQPVLNGVTARPDFTNRVDVMRLQLLARPNVEEIIYRAGLDKTINAETDMERRSSMEGMINWISQAVSIRSPRDMYFVIEFRHPDPIMAKRVTEATLNLLIEQDIGANLSESVAARRRLDLQIEEYEERLRANELLVAEFRQQNGGDLGATEGAERRRSQKETELAQTTEEISRARGRVTTLRNILSATPRQTTGGELDRLRIELADLRSRYEESHPDIAGVIARIDELQQADNGLGRNPEYVRLQSELSIARDSIAALEAREAALRDELTQLDIAVGQAPGAVAELQQIERRYATTKKTYEELLARRDRLQLTESLGPGGRGVEYQIFEQPEQAINPVSPARALYIQAVIVLALGAGFAAALILNLLDKSYSQTSELERAFGLPVLGAISETPSQDVRRSRRWNVLGLASAGALLVAVSYLYIYVSVDRLPGEAVEDARLDVNDGGRASWG